MRFPFRNASTAIIETPTVLPERLPALHIIRLAPQ
jgi:hypothetical protein